MNASAPPVIGRILVVDDQAANRRAVIALLTRHHYEVFDAESGEQAVERARQDPPDLVLLDMMMPGMDGFELVRHFKEDDALRRIPIVFLTAAHDRELLVRAFESGAVDYVTKPFMPEELLARVSAHVGLKQTRDRLERVARERQELVNLVAHDLKNPLSSIVFASDVLRNNAAAPERVPRYLEVIQESADDALGYIRQYLEMQASLSGRRSDGPSGSRNLTLAWSELFDSLERRYDLMLEQRGKRLNLSPPGRDAQVSMDGMALRQVIENLVTNALKYAPDGDIDLSVHNGSPGYWQLHVEDRGPGIPPSDAKKLFLPFSRLGRQDDGHSSGLGLSLARQIMQAAGGNLWYEDREGGGARFVMEVPAAGAAGKR